MAKNLRMDRASAESPETVFLATETQEKVARVRQRIQVLQTAIDHSISTLLNGDRKNAPQAFHPIPRIAQIRDVTDADLRLRHYRYAGQDGALIELGHHETQVCETLERLQHIFSQIQNYRSQLETEQNNASTASQRLGAILRHLSGSQKEAKDGEKPYLKTTITTDDIRKMSAEACVAFLVTQAAGTGSLQNINRTIIEKVVGQYYNPQQPQHNQLQTWLADLQKVEQHPPQENLKVLVKITDQEKALLNRYFQKIGKNPHQPEHQDTLEELKLLLENIEQGLRERCSANGLTLQRPATISQSLARELQEEILVQVAPEPAQRLVQTSAPEMTAASKRRPPSLIALATFMAVLGLRGDVGTQRHEGPKKASPTSSVPSVPKPTPAMPKLHQKTRDELALFANELRYETASPQEAREMAAQIERVKNTFHSTSAWFIFQNAQGHTIPFHESYLNESGGIAGTMKAHPDLRIPPHEDHVTITEIVGSNGQLHADGSAVRFSTGYEIITARGKQYLLIPLLDRDGVPLTPSERESIRYRLLEITDDVIYQVGEIREDNRSYERRLIIPLQGRNAEFKLPNDINGGADGILTTVVGVCQALGR